MGEDEKIVTDTFLSLVSEIEALQGKNSVLTDTSSSFKKLAEKVVSCINKLKLNSAMVSFTSNEYMSTSFA